VAFKGLLLLRRFKHLVLTRVSKNQKHYGQGCAYSQLFLFEYGSYSLHIRMFRGFLSDFFVDSCLYSSKFFKGFNEDLREYPVLDNNITSIVNENFSDRPISRFVSSYPGNYYVNTVISQLFCLVLKELIFDHNFPDCIVWTNFKETESLCQRAADNRNIIFLNFDNRIFGRCNRKPPPTGSNVRRKSGVE